MNIDLILSKLDKVQKTGSSKWKALCPVHDEKTPSFSIGIGRSGNVVAHCFGCGANMPEIMDALGLNWDDVFLNPIGRQTSNKDYQKEFNAKQVLELLSNECIILASLLIKISKPDINFSEQEKCLHILASLGTTDSERILQSCERIIDATRYTERF